MNDRLKSLGVTDFGVANKKALEFVQEKEREAAGEVNLEVPVPHVIVRAETAKNKKEESVCLVPEIVEALKAYRPTN